MTETELESFRNAPIPQGLRYIYMQDPVLFPPVLWQQRFQCLQSYQVPTGHAGDFASLAHIKTERGAWGSQPSPAIGTANT